MQVSLFSYFLRLFPKRSEPKITAFSQYYTLIIQSMMRRIILPSQATKIKTQTDAFCLADADVQKRDFASVYFLIEQFITETDPLKKYTRENLRAEILTEFPEILHIENISFIFQGANHINLYLYKLFLNTVTEKTETVLGSFKGNKLLEIRQWLNSLPYSEVEPPFDVQAPSKMNEENALMLIQEVSHQLFIQIESYIGERCPSEIWNETYEELNRIYGCIENFPHLLQLIPSKILDESKLKLLSRIQIEETLLQQTYTLKEINRQIISQNHELIKAQKEISAAREKEEESHSMLMTILDTVGEGIITIDENSIIIRANREAELIWGYGLGELNRKPIDILMPNSMKKKHHDGMSRYLQSGSSDILGKWIVLSGIHKNGSIFPIEMKIQETFIGKKRFFTAALHDISERVRKEAELKEKNGELDMLIYKTSHDLRGPITTVLGLVNIIQLFPEDSVKYVNMIEKSIIKLDQTIRDLMDFGQLNNPSLTNTEINLQDLFTEILEYLQKTDGFESVNIQMDISPDLFLFSKRSIIKTIFQNLMLNSIRYRQKISEESYIRLFAESKNNRILVRVKDNGQGIPIEFHDKIFEMFFRANVNTSGTGLGLYIVKKSVEVLNGTIIMHSEPDCGTEFSLTFPAKPCISHAENSSHLIETKLL